MNLVRDNNFLLNSSKINRFGKSAYIVLAFILGEYKGQIPYKINNHQWAPSALYISKLGPYNRVSSRGAPGN